MNNLKMLRLLPSEAEKHDECTQEFLKDSNDGKLVAVYIVHPSEGLNFLISEYENGMFWTIAQNEEHHGTLTGAVNLLLKYFV